MERIVLKMNAFRNTSKPGFTFIELIIAIVLIGIMAIIVVPNFMSDNLVQDRQENLAKLNTLLATAQYNAISANKLTRVVLDLKSSKIYLEEISNQKDSLGQDLYEPVKIDYNDTSLIWDPNLKIEAIYINNQNELLSQLELSDKVWFYIVPDGNAQSVMINFTDLKANEKFNEMTQFSLVLNPFIVQFKLYDYFQKPV